VTTAPATVRDPSGARRPAGTGTTTSAADTARERRRRVGVWLVPVLVFLAAFVPRLQSVGVASSDEPAWLRRSVHYVDAYTSLDLPNATSISSGGGTMPGITTAAVGGTARLLWSASRGLGLADDKYPFDDSRRGLFLAQTIMALVNALLIVGIWWVLTCWISRRVATVAAVILATEPFLLVHGARLTTDSFVMLFGALGAFATAAALGIPRLERNVVRRRTLAIVAGIGLAGAVASKLSFLTVLPFVAGLLVLALIRRPGLERRELVGVLLAVLASGVAFLALTWPALFLDPMGQIDVMRTSAEQVGIERLQFFYGEATADPGVWFYPVVMAFRSTPWLFVLGLASPIAFVSRRTRPYAVLMALYCLVPFVVITFASLKYDRYTLPLWPAGAVLAALVIDVLAYALGRRIPSVRRFLSPAIGVLLVGVTLASLSVTPDAGVYANPLIGGGPAAEDAIIIGGAAASRVGELIEDREGDACDRRRIFATRYGGHLRFPCGKLVADPAELRAGDYLVVDRLTITRGKAKLADFLKYGDRVAHVRRRGVDLADVIVVR
jgi:hypothetical protein